MLTYHLIVILLFDFVMFGWSVKPVFDVANNMRLVLLPGKTHTHTHFRVPKSSFSTLLHIKHSITAKNLSQTHIPSQVTPAWAQSSTDFERLTQNRTTHSYLKSGVRAAADAGALWQPALEDDTHKFSFFCLRNFCSGTCGGPRQ